MAQTNLWTRRPTVVREEPLSHLTGQQASRLIGEILKVYVLSLLSATTPGFQKHTETIKDMEKLTGKKVESRRINGS